MRFSTTLATLTLLALLTGAAHVGMTAERTVFLHHWTNFQ